MDETPKEIIDALRSNSGGRVKLDDLRTIHDLSELTEGEPDFYFTCKGVREIKFEGGETQTLVELHHVDTDYKVLLVLKEVEDVYDLKLYNFCDWFEPANRADHVRQDHAWLFDMPADLPEGAEMDDYSRIDYAGVIPDGDDRKFARKQRVEMGKDCDGYPVALVEYLTQSDDLDNYELLLIETGGLDSPLGGLIEFYEGRLITDNDLHL